MGHAFDIDRWTHRQHFDYFRGFAQPFFGVCADVDVTAAWQRSREPGGPAFVAASLHAAVLAADRVEALRLRIHGDRVWCHDHVAISTTVMRDDETFGYARIDHASDPAAFATAARRTMDATRQQTGLPEPEGDDAVIYHSTLPWLKFTAFANALPLRDSIPRLMFGRVTASGERMVMPVALEVHHAVVHGLDVARYYEQLEAHLR